MRPAGFAAGNMKNRNPKDPPAVSFNEAGGFRRR